MKTIYTTLLLLALQIPSFAITFYSAGSGAWTSGTTWSILGCGRISTGLVPNAGDIVIICSNHTITSSTSIALGGGGNLLSLTVESGGTLNMPGENIAVNNGGILDVCGTMTVQNVSITNGASVTICSGALLTVTKNFANQGNITINGMLTVAGNFSNANDIISGNGCITVKGNYSNSGTIFGVVGGISPPCVSPLPIQLVSFTATYQEEANSVLLNWVVASQLNNKEFVIEKTTDGDNYEQVTTISGAGTTPFTQTYSAIDNHPNAGTTYYRLKQVDIDGNVTIFPPTALFIGNSQVNSLTLYPNPVANNGSLVYTSTTTDPLNLSIVDLIGRTVSSSTLNNIQSGENTFIINTSTLPRGIYFMRARAGDKAFTLKFSKQ